MRKSYGVPVLVVVGMLAVLTAFALSTPEVSFRSAERDGVRVAEVVVDEQPVIVLRTPAGGLSPLERAEIVAGRLQTALAGDVEPDDVSVTAMEAGARLSIGQKVIVGVSVREAEAHGATPTALAEQWRKNLLLALGYDESEIEVKAETPGEAETEAEPGKTTSPAVEKAAPAIDWTGTAQKWVPILSVDEGGVQIGAAQVAGPPAQVDQVKGVAQLRLSFKNIGRIYAYIPVRTLTVTKLDRVQGVSVWATGELQLVNF